MAEKEPPIPHSDPQPELGYEDPLTHAAIQGLRYEDLVEGQFGGRLASVKETIVIPDVEYHKYDDILQRGSNILPSSD